MKLLYGSFISCALLAGSMPAADVPNRGEITALARTFLRDSAELPMDVQVQTLVTDAKGKKKRDAHSNVRFFFSGFNAKSERYTFRSTAGFMSLRILHDSLAGNFVAINAFTSLAPQSGKPDGVTIEPGATADTFAIRSQPAADCSRFRMSTKYLYPELFCYSVLFHVTKDGSGKLTIQNFAVDIEKLPVQGKVGYLGDAQIRKIHSTGEVQEAHLGDDPRPFLVPKRVTTTIETDKGSVVVTNDYTLQPDAKK